MKKISKMIPGGVPCLAILMLLFGYLGTVMGLTNMLNTIMKTAHDLLLNTVFYLMGMCVITGALGKILTEFGVVNLLQRLLRPVMRPVFNMPGVASLGAVLTFLSDNPAIIALSKDRAFAQYFKKYEHVSLVNFGTAFGMGLLVIVFMMGQGYFFEPFLGFFGAMCGCVIATRLMQFFTIKMYPSFKFEDAISPEGQKPSVGENVDAVTQDELYEESLRDASGVKESKGSIFVHVLNSLLDGGRDGVTIGLAIIPGVLIISTLVMMLTFGGSVEGIDPNGNEIVVYTGSAYEGTQLLPWLASKISFVFEYLFGFTAPELISFPITALGAVGAALGLIPEFTSKGIIDGNAIAVCTAMGMCWSGYLSTDAATLDSLGYRTLVPKAFLSTFIGGICAGIITHWTYVIVITITSLFAPEPVWEKTVDCYYPLEQVKHFPVKLTAYDDSTYIAKDWYGEKGYDLHFSVNQKDSTVNILNSYAQRDDKFFFVRITGEEHRGEPSYAVLYPNSGYSNFQGNKKSGTLFIFAFIYDGTKRMLTRGYYELNWGGYKRETAEAELSIQKEINAEKIEAEHAVDSIQKAALVDSLFQVNTSEKYGVQ